MNLYAKHPFHHDNCEVFRKFMIENPALTFYQPNESQAPWHVQAKTPGDEVIDFWPHKMKGCYQGKVMSGFGGLMKLVELANVVDDFEVTED